MNLTKILTALTAAAILATSASAVTITVAYTADIVATQPANNGDDVLLAWAQASVNTYNASQFTSLPSVPSLGIKTSAGGTSGGQFDFTSGTTSITLALTAGNYMLVSWGGSSLPIGNGTADMLYYIQDAGTYTFTNNGVATGGLSSLHHFGTITPSNETTVPDSGTTLMLLGGVLIGLVAVRRFLR